MKHKKQRRRNLRRKRKKRTEAAGIHTATPFDGQRLMTDTITPSDIQRLEQIARIAGWKPGMLEQYACMAFGANTLRDIREGDLPDLLYAASNPPPPRAAVEPADSSKDARRPARERRGSCSTFVAKAMP